MNTTDTEKCTCGRNLGQDYGTSQQEREDEYLDFMFGEDTRTPEEKEKDLQEQIRRDLRASNKRKEYLTKHHVDVSGLNEFCIEEAYKKCVRSNMTKEERQYAANMNVMRILRGFPPLAYK